MFRAIMLTLKLESWIFTCLLGTLPVMASWCEYFCDPKNHMKPTCDDQCPGYVYIVSTSTTPAAVPTSMGPDPAANTTILGRIQFVEGSIANTVTFIMIPVSAILLMAVLFCLLKKKIRVCLSKIRDKKLKFPQQVEDDQASGRMIELNDLNVSNDQSASDLDDRRYPDADETQAFLQEHHVTDAALDQTETEPKSEHCILNIVPDAGPGSCIRDGEN